jgi:uncharacterized protein with HEPN domain
MLEDVIRENLKVIIESIALIEERFEKINSADDFVSNSHGTFVLDAISMRLQIVGELIKKIDKIDDSLFRKYPEIEWGKIMKLRDIISHHYDLTKILYFSQSNELGV